MRVRQALLGAALVGAVVVGSASPGGAAGGAGRYRSPGGGGGNVEVDGDDVGRGAGLPGSPGAPGGSTGGYAIEQGDPCPGGVWNFAPIPAAQNAAMHESRGTVPAAGQYVYMWCGGDVAGRRIVWSRNLNPDPAAVAREVADSVTPPSVRLRFSPADQQLVGVETWLWVDPADWQAVTPPPLVLGPITVTVTFTPDRVEWDMGDGSDVVTCEGPGTAYDRSKPEDEQSTDCSYTYERSSARERDRRYRGEATIRWTVTATITGQPSPDLPEVSSSEPFALRVAESQAVGTR